MSGEPTAYDRVQNRWIYAGIFMWMLTLIVAIATTADVVGSVVRAELNELRERIVVLESKS